MANNLGTLTLDLVAKIGGFTQSMDRAANVTEKSMKQISDATNRAKSIVTSLFSLAIGGYTLKGLADMADQYGQMADRIRAVTSSTDEYNTVQKRLLQSANSTYRPLQEAQELYIRTSDTLKNLGYNTEQALDITDSFSYLLVTSAASADRANSAINALSKSIQTGKVNSESWQTILQAMPSIVDSIASSSGKTADQVRKLGIEGKLSLQDLLEAYRNTVSANKDLADAMGTTINDALTRFKNNLSSFIGEANRANGVTQSLADVISVLGNNIDVIASVAFVALSGRIGAMTATLVGSAAATINQTRASIQNAMASRQQTLATIEATQAKIADIAAEKAFTVATQQSLVSQLRLAQTEAARTTIRNQLKTNSAQIIALTNAETAANTRLAASQSAAAGVGGILRNALLGPAGVGIAIATAAASWLLFRDNTNEANKASIAHINTLEQLKNELIGLTGIEILNRQVAFSKQFEEESRKSQESIANLRKAIVRDFSLTQGQFEERVRLFEDYERAIRDAASRGEDIAELTTKIIEQIQPTKEGSQAILQFAGTFFEAEKQMAFFGNGLDVISEKFQAFIKGVRDEKPTNDSPILSFGTNSDTQKQLDTINSTIKRYREQVATLGMSSREVELYKLQTQGATQSQLQLADSLLSQVEAFNKAKEATKGQIEQQQWLSAQTDALRARLDEYSLNLMAMSMGDKEAQNYRDIIAIQREYADERKRLIEAQAGENKLSEQLFQERLDATDSYYNELLEKTKNYQEQRDQLEQSWTVGLSKAWENYRDETLNYSKQAGDFFNNTVGSMSSTLTDFLVDGEASFADFTKSVLKNITDIATRLAIVNGLQAFGFGFADGGVFAKGGAFRDGVQAFASGGAFTNSIVNKPTLFPFAKGTGLMGEAGPEAIMPLARTSSGDLGVKMITDKPGSSQQLSETNIQVYVNIDGNANTTTSTNANQAGNDLALYLDEAMKRWALKEKRQGGLLDPNNRRNQ